MVSINILPHLVARGRVLLVFPLVVAVLRQLLQELLLEGHGQLIDADVVVTRYLGSDLLLLFDVDPQGLRLRQELRGREGLLLLLLLLELQFRYL